MSDTKKFTCIGCPIGCPLQLTHEGAEIIEIEGYECNRGAKYARQEFTDPRRSLTTTVRLKGARWNRLPVKITQPIPKERILEAAALIHTLTVNAPVKTGDVVLRNILGLDGIDVVATRSAALAE
jgi:CxxC motif-containing protein